MSGNHEEMATDRANPAEIRAIALLSCAAFASAASLRVCDPLLPELARTFNTSTGHAAYIISAFSVTYGLMQAFYGPLGDHYGKYRVVALATLASAVGSIGSAIAGSLAWLVFARVVAGATAAAIIPLSMAWIGDTVPYERRQATLARFLTGQILGLVGGQLIGGFFADTLGWRWSFVLLAGIYVVVGMFLNAELRRNTSAHGATAPASTPAKRPSMLTQIRAVIGIAWARTILFTVFLEGMAVFGVLAFIPSYLHAQFDVSLTAAGAILSAYGLGGLSYTFFAKQLVSQIGESGLALGGGLLLGAAFIVLLLGPDWFWALPATFLAGLGFYMIHNTLQTNATQMAPNARGTAVSLFASAFFLGQSAGVAAAAMVIDKASVSWLFAIAAAILPLIGSLLAHALRIRHSMPSSV
jgi:MFS transporter, YNFM family, putative membrane transport protein